MYISILDVLALALNLPKLISQNGIFVQLKVAALASPIPQIKPPPPPLPPKHSPLWNIFLFHLKYDSYCAWCFLKRQKRVNASICYLPTPSKGLLIILSA